MVWRPVTTPGQSGLRSRAAPSGILISFRALSRKTWNTRSATLLSAAPMDYRLISWPSWLTTPFRASPKLSEAQTCLNPPRGRSICSMPSVYPPRPMHITRLLLVLMAKKLGKRFGSDPVGRLPATEVVAVALQFLGQKPAGGMDLKELWSWACEHWQAESIPRVECMRVELSS